MAQVTDDHKALLKRVGAEAAKMDELKGAILTKLQRHHHCQRCGHCCTVQTPVVMTGREMLAAARFLEMDPREFRRVYCPCRQGEFRLITQKKGKCPFLDGEPGQTRCLIWKVRPEVCKRFPFLSPITILETVLPDIAVNDKMCPQMSATVLKVKGAGL